MILFSLLILLLNSLNTNQQNEENEQLIDNNLVLRSKLNNTNCNQTVCKLPLCKCADELVPGNLHLNDVPMMILLTFNGIIQREHVTYLKKILNPVYKNPNGCPVQATFFVSDSTYAKTDYCSVQKLFNNNNEIGVGAEKYSCPYTDCKSTGRMFHAWSEDKAQETIFQQKRNIARKGKINPSFLRGFRLPLLDSKGNVHYNALKKYAFNYESSIIISQNDIGARNGLRYWPHTLDYQLPYKCESCPEYKTLCLNKNCSMESFWIVPMHFINADREKPCPTLLPIEMFDDQMSTRDCIKPEEITEKVLLETLFYNFQRHYVTNKAPFVLNIETSWFRQYGDMLTNALVKFISQMSNNRTSDVYFMTIAKAIDWIQYPVPLNIIGNKWLWDCDGLDFDYDQECDFIDESAKHAEEERLKEKKAKMEQELRGEDLYRNGVLSGVIIVFVLAVLFIILYDRYN